ncbi:MAG: methylmalonyl-CoA mutase family protein [Prevotellaceae bacterium]|jgi:methylmalonyl-CoA mutase|nr:methylmalonyl-CoA mutase family protein [Prevotellaceae bacterium]
MAEKLFTEFPPVSTEQWEEVINKDLKGADYEKKLVWKTMDGFNVRPYYRAEDLKNIKFLQYKPDEYPYVRGNRACNEWKILQNIKVTDVKEANRLALDALSKGANAIGFCVHGKEKELSQAEFDTLFEGIVLDATDIFITGACCKSPKYVEMFANRVKDQKKNPEQVMGGVEFDPLRRLTLKGSFCKSMEEDMAELRKAVVLSDEFTWFRPISVSGYIFHNAGSSIVQELAFSLAMGNEYMARLTESGLNPDQVATKMMFSFAVSSNYFMEIAKFRAARLLWANIVHAYGTKFAISEKMKISAITSEWNQTVYDPYVNMLRGTTEAMSAALGNIQWLTVTPFDKSFRKPAEFSDRIARNVQNILKEESYFDKVADPAAGSYYIENLTNSIAEEAWKLFKEIEDKGGYIEAFKAGFIQDQIKAMASKRDMNIAIRREILLGTNQYPNFTETLDKEVRENFANPKCCCGGHKNTGEKIAEPIKTYRAGMAFEELRMKTENSGKQPMAFMLTFGNLAMCRARAQFSSNFFACAGIKVVDNNRFSTIEDGVKAAIEAKADIVVACSSDDEYAETVPQIAEKLGNKAILVVAGDPASKPELESKGITHFISARSNVLETLQQHQKELGI